jgi:hypothetical protein
LKTGFLSVVFYYVLNRLLGTFIAACVVGTLLVFSSESRLLFRHSIDIFPIETLFVPFFKRGLAHWQRLHPNRDKRE